MINCSPGFMARRFFSATGLLTPSHTVDLSRSRSAKEYSEGSVLSRYGMRSSFSNQHSAGKHLAIRSYQLSHKSVLKGRGFSHVVTGSHFASPRAATGPPGPSSGLGH